MHLKLPVYFIFITLVYVLESCSILENDADSEIMDLNVNHYKATAFGEAPQLVYLVQEGAKIGGENWEYFYSDILEFDYEPGYVYRLKIKKEVVEDPPQDAAQYTYTLVSIRSKEKVPEDLTFEVRLKWGGHNFVTESNQAFSLLDQYNIDCSELCETLSRNLREEESVTGVFSHNSGNSLRLISLL